jgi:hypothetical protein
MDIVTRAQREIDCTIFPKDVRDILCIISKIELTEHDIRNKSSERALQMDDMASDLRLAEADIGMNETEIRKKQQEFKELRTEYCQMTNQLLLFEKQLHDYKYNLRMCVSFSHHMQIVFCSINVHDNPFFADKLEYMTLYDARWKFINPRGQPLSYSRHHVEDLSMVVKRLNKFGLHHFVFPYDDYDNKVYRWLNKQEQYVCEEDPRYITILIHFYSFYKEQDKEQENPVPPTIDDRINCCSIL